MLAHHRKGLGRGLAIVKRLADLIGAPTAVRSRVGHGTVFTIEVPVGRAPRHGVEAEPGGVTLPLGLTLQGRLILVVEDEIAVRARWPGRRLPAIVITGSSLGGHEDEAVNHGYHLLVKPVLPNKLRAMIAFKLGVR